MKDRAWMELSRSALAHNVALLRAQLPPGLGDVPPVPGVKGVIFGYDAGSCHVSSSQVEKSAAAPKIPVVLCRGISYNKSSLTVLVYYAVSLSARQGKPNKGALCVMKVLVINAGSSSLKYQLLDPSTEEVLAQGLCERIGIDHRSYRGTGERGRI